MVVKSNSAKDTGKFANKLAKKFLKTGGVIALIGDLGAGKTIFAQGFAKGLGIKEKIISPTFILQREYKIPSSKKILYHLDLYRLENEEQFKHLGLEELFESGNIILIEWADKIKNIFPKNTTILEIKKISENERQILLKEASDSLN